MGEVLLETPSRGHDSIRVRMQPVAFINGFFRKRTLSFSPGMGRKRFLFAELLPCTFAADSFFPRCCTRVLYRFLFCFLPFSTAAENIRLI